VPKIAKERAQENQQRIESAALELFTTQGFHGTNNREIAAKLGVSTGTIHTYFSSKEAIFSSLTRKPSEPSGRVDARSGRRSEQT
jgi:AcrR family transcriptional regulator